MKEKTKYEIDKDKKNLLEMNLYIKGVLRGGLNFL